MTNPVVSTTSKSEPLMLPSVCRTVSFHFELGAPVMYQGEPLSARIIPPLVTTADEVELALETLGKALDAAGA